MSKQCIGLLPCITLLFTSGCFVDVTGSGEISTRDVDIDDIRAVEVCCGLDVEIYESTTPSLVLTGDDNIIDEVLVNDSGGTLRLRLPTNLTFRPTRSIKASIGTAAIDKIDASGGSDIVARGVPQGSRVELDGSEGSSFEFTDIETMSLEIDLSGGSDAELSGTAADQTVELSGGSVYRGYELAGDIVTVEASGGSRAEVSASMALDVDASGGSTVRHDGEPTIKKSLSGGSAVSPR
ncbi:MAG: head GIN domain-containing protein [Myxococcota bacterium]